MRLVVSTFIREKQPFLKKVVLTSSAIKEDKTSQTKEKYVFKVKILIWLYEVPRKILRSSKADQFKAKIHRSGLLQYINSLYTLFYQRKFIQDPIKMLLIQSNGYILIITF